jgi:hypothetical protein
MQYRYHIDRGYVGFRNGRFRWHNPNVQMLFRIDDPADAGTKPVIACVRPVSHSLTNSRTRSFIRRFIIRHSPTFTVSSFTRNDYDESSHTHA